ncbi:DUF4157 domain-containing protein [Streptomyces cyaneofuscatus]|uniref:eCIS core domain-containing protein n=1 Tax=Streptomyces cyaneofuscatus TaxID=66883 RepID=UPI0036536D56
MHAQENDRTVRAEPATRTPGVEGGTPPPYGLVEMQSTVGNAAVVQMLRELEYAVDQEGHRHGAGCGHGSGSGGRSGGGVVRRSAVHDVLRTPGRPLDDANRGDMEARLGADFSDVRIHNDSAARASAAEVGARAYTSGSHVVIGDGGADKHTLAHELTHVIQQRSGPVAGTVNGAGLKVSDPSDPSDRFEREAEANATRVMRSAAPEAAAPVQRARASAPASGVAAVQRAAELNPLNGGTTTGAFGQAVAGAEPEGVGTVAIVPVVLSQSLNLMDVAQKYEEGFAGGTAPADRFALVIGVNIRVRNPQEAAAAQALLNQKTAAFLGAWGANRFRVAVTGFTWANHATDAQETNQRTIPYGEIRDRIMRSPETTAMIAGLRGAGRQHVYLHTSDSDTASFDTEAGAPVLGRRRAPGIRRAGRVQRRLHLARRQQDRRQRHPDLAREPGGPRRPQGHGPGGTQPGLLPRTQHLREGARGLRRPGTRRHLRQRGGGGPAPHGLAVQEPGTAA